MALSSACQRTHYDNLEALDSEIKWNIEHKRGQDCSYQGEALKVTSAF